MRLAAPAFPVRSPPGDNLWIQRAIYAAQPGEVLVVDTGGGLEFGYWGEILTEAAIARDLAGLVIHGGVRDSDRLIEMGWPVFAERVCIQGTAKDPACNGQLGDTIRIGTVDVGRGDLIVGDADGVAVIPASLRADIQALSDERERAESQYVERLRAGETTLEIYRLS
jgi:4-hydroxy-4-methyl-2-oxoglutarate aldolase